MSENQGSKKVKAWGGWQKIEKLKKPKKTLPKEAFTSAPAEPKIKENPFDPKKLTRINKQSHLDKANEAHAREIGRVNEIKRETICEYSGDTITQDAFFVFAPNRKQVSRRIRQSRNHCENCGDPVKSLIPSQVSKHCDPCNNKGVCSCVRSEKTSGLERLEGKRGLYCQTCRQGPYRCEACGVPMPAHQNGLNLCPFCETSSIENAKTLTSLHMEIESFFFELDLDATGLECQVELMEVKWDRPIRLDQALVIQKNQILVDPRLPELNFLERVAWHYAQDLAGHWKKISDPLISNVLSAFFVYLFFDHKRYYIQAHKQKKIGFSLSKTFQPLYQAYFKLGLKGGYKYLRNKLG